MSVTTTTTVPASTTTSRTRSFFTTGPVWLVSVAAVVVGAAVTEAYAWCAKAIDIPMKATTPSNDVPQDMRFGGFAGGVVFWSIAGIVLAVVLARKAKRPARTFVVTTVVLTAISLTTPFISAKTDTATEVAFALGHVVAAAVIIPLIARRLQSVAGR